MDRENIDKIAKTSEDRIFLSKIWDKIYFGMSRNIPAHTAFLSPREQKLARFLFGAQEGLLAWGGYPESERKMLLYLPDYLDESYLENDDCPLKCIRTSFYEGDCPTHRDFLGALIGCGIQRETIGDICIGENSCDFFVTAGIAPYILQNFTSAGRTKVHPELISPNQVQIPQPKTKEIRDTVASVRLDSIISSGFRIGRSLAAKQIVSGKVSINGLPCDKPDKSISERDKISVRGMGKILLKSINGETKKGRISVLIDRYL